MKKNLMLLVCVLNFTLITSTVFAVDIDEEMSDTNLFGTSATKASSPVEKKFYASLGYSMGTKGVNNLVYKNNDQKEVAECVGRTVLSEETSLSGLAAKFGWNITDKIFVEINHTFGETKEEIRTDYRFEYDIIDAYGNIFPLPGLDYGFNYREISIKSSPEISINYVLFKVSECSLYIGGGIRSVSVEGKGGYVEVTNLNAAGPTMDQGPLSFSSSELKPSAKIGIKFPFAGLLGSADYTYCPITFCSDMEPVGHFETSLGASTLKVSLGIPF